MKSFLGYIANKIVQSTPRSKKVGPTIKSVKPTKDVAGSVKKTKSDEYVKRIRELESAEKKIKSGKEMIKEGQKARKNMIDTKRAFQFKHGKSTHAIKPGDKPEIKYKGNVKEQKATGGRVGLKEGSPKKKKKLDQGDILGNRFDKKFKKLALSKEAQLHAKDYDAGLDRAEKRAAKEVAQEAGLPMTMAKGGRVGRRLGGGMDMSRRKTAVEKIKETFSPKSKNKNLKPVDKKKNPGLAKLPIEVRNKMGYAKKGGRA